MIPCDSVIHVCPVESGGIGVPAFFAAQMAAIIDFSSPRPTWRPINCAARARNVAMLGTYVGMGHCGFTGLPLWAAIPWATPAATAPTSASAPEW